MIYEYTVHNLLYLMRSIPMATEEQLQMFFARSNDKLKISDIIKQLLNDRILIRQVQSGEYEVLTIRRPIRFSRRAVEDFIDAFWVIANMGAENVNYVCTSNGATKYVVILDDEQSSIYDITVCRTAEEARVGMITRGFMGEEDDVTHIALCYSVEVGEALKKKLIRYHYDTYCVIDPTTHKATYYALEDEDDLGKDV